jgi:hypothetical protein
MRCPPKRESLVRGSLKFVLNVKKPCMTIRPSFEIGPWKQVSVSTVRLGKRSPVIPGVVDVFPQPIGAEIF